MGKNTADVFEKQEWHFVILSLILVITNYIIISYPAFFGGSLWSISTITWLWMSIAASVIHQIYVMLIWRTQLKYQWLTSILPKFGYIAFVIDYMLLLLLRVCLLVIVALANSESLEISFNLRCLFFIVTTIIIVVGFFSLYFKTGKLYWLFGYEYFFPSKMKNREVSMHIYYRKICYVIFSLALYLPGIMFSSFAALVLALINTVYILVHCYCTEVQ